MNSFRVLLITIVAAIILPQAVPVVQMGMNTLHNGHQKSAPVEACNKTLPCFLAHQSSLPPAVNILRRLWIVLMILGFVVTQSLRNDRPQWTERHRIRQFLYNRVGLHMHAFDSLRFWISSGMMGQKISDISTQ